MQVTEKMIEDTLRRHIKVDATGLSPAVASAFVTGFAEAAAALTAALSDQEREVEVKAGDEIADAVLSWMVRYDLLDAGNEYQAADVLAVLNDLAPAPALVDVPVEPVNRKFKLGDHVCKTKGSSWIGHVVGFYSTELTPVGYAVESSRERGSVQIYPEAALKLIGPASPHREGEDSAEVIEEGAKLLAAWFKYSWDGLGDRDISGTYPDFTKIPHFQGGKPALRKIAAAILALAATRSASATSPNGGQP